MNNSDVKEIIRDLLARLPNVAANNALRGEINALLAAPNVVGEPYVRTITWSGLAAGGVTPASWTVDASAPFLIQAGTYFADIAAAIQTDSSRVIPLVNVQLQNTGTGQNFFDNAVPVPCMFGTGEEPYVWPQAKFMPASSVLQAIPLNRTGATTYNLTLCFHGVRLIRQ